MKSYRKLNLSIFFIFSITNIVQSQTRNFDGGTQTEMNFNAGETYFKWQKKMQKVLTAAFEKNKKDKLFVENLKKSQKLWENWRDAEIETFFPKYKDSMEFYGSIQPLCYHSKLIDWTEDRIKQLEIYSKGVAVDDSCGPGRM